MLQKFQRPLSEAEREYLKLPLESVPRIVTMSSTLRTLAICGAVLALCMYLFALGIRQPEGAPGIWMVTTVLAALLGLISFCFGWMVASSHLHWAGHARRFAREDAPEIRKALNDGKAMVCSVTSASVIVIEECEDEGSTYIYDLGDGTSFYLRGQDYGSMDDEVAWPAKEFEIVRTALGQRWVGIFAGAEPVEKMRTLSMSEMSENYGSSDEPRTETILAGTPEEILRSLGFQGDMETPFLASA